MFVLCVCVVSAKVSGEEDEVANMSEEEFKIELEGSRSGNIYLYDVRQSDTVAMFKKRVFYDIHGHDIRESEEDFTNGKNIMTKPGNKILDGEKTLKHYGIKKADPPHRLIYVIGIHGGMGKRATTLIVSKERSS